MFLFILQAKISEKIRKHKSSNSVILPKQNISTNEKNTIHSSFHNFCLLCAKKKPVKPPLKPVAAKPLTSIDSISYAMGIQTAQYYKSQGIEKINAAMVKKAYSDVFDNKTTLLSPEQANMTIQKKMQEFMMQKASAQKEAGENF